MQTFTEIELNQGYAVCSDCESNIHTLQAGFDAKRIACTVCGYSVIPVSEFNKTMDGAEILSK